MLLSLLLFSVHVDGSCHYLIYFQLYMLHNVSSFIPFLAQHKSFFIIWLVSDGSLYKLQRPYHDHGDTTFCQEAVRHINNPVGSALAKYEYPQ